MYLTIEALPTRRCMATTIPRGGGGNLTQTYPRCVGSIWMEMGPFLPLRELNSVLLNGCVFRGFTSIWAISSILVYPYGCISSVVQLYGYNCKVFPSPGTESPEPHYRASLAGLLVWNPMYGFGIVLFPRHYGSILCGSTMGRFLKSQPTHPGKDF